MAGKNIIMSRGVPVQKNDPAILQTLSDKAVTRLVNGKITDYNGSNIDPYEFTLAEFKTKSASDFTGVDLVITDVHTNYLGVGGLRVRGGSQWTMRDYSAYFSTRAAALAAFPAASYPGFRIFSADYGSYGGGYEVSDGSAYNTERETIVYRDPATSNVLIIPSVAATDAADNAGTVRLTFGSAHGITAGQAYPGGGLPNAQLYVTASGNGWTAGTWHTITNIPDTTHIDVSTSSAGITGAPTLATVASASVVTMKTITIPPLSANGSLIIDALTVATISSNNKNLTIKLNGNTLFAPTFNSATSVSLYTPSRWGIVNVGSRSSQKTTSSNTSPFGIGSANSANPGTSAVDTSGNTTLTLNWQPAAVNERMYFENITVSVRP